MIVVERLVLRNIRVPLGKPFDGYDEAAIDKARHKLRRLRLPCAVDEKTCAVYKKSVDARKKNEIAFLYSVIVSLSSPLVLTEDRYEALCSQCSKENAVPLLKERLSYACGNKPLLHRPVVVGFGPCGMFCALTLARAGMRPLVIERGQDVDRRAELVETYWKTGVLNEETNVQFGEGGAGTFSDGKLMTRINDPLCAEVLDTFYRHGADQSILTAAKPHVGTDKLRVIVKNIRSEIESLGGTVLFGTRLSGITTDSSGRVTGITLNAGEALACEALFLAIGHSARDSFRMLSENEFSLIPKPYSVGVRIEHRQQTIDRALYGAMAGHPALPVGEYAVSRHVGDRTVYSFCMCPGGTVVASASEPMTIVTNGMSESARDGVNANAALAVSVSPDDYGNTVEGAIGFQHELESRAWFLGSGAAPCETVGHFLDGGCNTVSDVQPSYTGNTSMLSMEALFPSFVTACLRDGIRAFDRQIEGFSGASALLTGPETRTSSPVRIPRNGDFSAIGHDGVYPCGEGAGYAGGITSAAVDGIRAALAFMKEHTFRA